MNVTTKGRGVTSAPVGLGLLAGAGSTAALLATYWDDSWHTDKGRDEFAIPPHLLLYGGVLVASLCVAVWGLLAWRRAGWGVEGVRLVLAQPGLLLAGIGGTTTLLSGPVDAAWHELYGRDAVLWSPPHLVAVFGTLALSVGLLAGLRNTAGRGAGLARLLAAAGVIGTLQVPVLEYDSDVPQFSVLWFLPVAALGVCTAIALLNDLLPRRSQAVVAAVIYTLLRLTTVGILALLGFSLTAVPPVLVLFALDALLRDRPLGPRLVFLGAVAPLAWWPLLLIQSEVTTVVAGSLLPAAVVLGACAGGLVALAHGDLRPRLRGGPHTAAAVVALVALALLTVPWSGQASAHDPGQGEQVRQARLTVVRDAAGNAELTLALPGGCDRLEATGTVARRAGQVRRGPLSLASNDGGCQVSGRVAGLNEGRWFVYAELRSDTGRPLEVWLPTAQGTRQTEIRPLYAPPQQADSASRNVIGAGLLAVTAGLLVATLRLARRSARSENTNP